MYMTANLNFFKKNYNKLYEILQNRNRNKEHYVLTLSKSGDPNLVIKKGEAATPVHSSYNPYGESEKWLTRYENDIRDTEHICLYGIGLGYYLEEIIKKYPRKKIFIYEPDIEILLACLEARDMRALLNHSNIVSIGFGRDEISKERFINSILSKSYESFSFLIAPSYLKLYDRDFQEFNANFSKRLKSYRSNLATYQRFGLEWTENIFHNLPYLIKSTPIYNLRDVFKGVPAIIVGSGPSLQIDIQQLKELKSSALIIAAGSSIQALVKAGIEPHLVVSIDGGEDNYKVFKNIDLKTIPLGASSFLKKKILGHVKAPLFHVPLNIDTISMYLFDLFDIHPKIFSTTSVTGTAIQLASLFGCSKIIFMGQDLSFPNDQYYSTGVVHIKSENLNKTISQADLIVKNVNGGVNKTSKNMYVTLKDIEFLIKFINPDNQISFINTSKEGAHIEGTEFLTIEEVHKQLTSSQVINESLELLLSETFLPYEEEIRMGLQRRLKYLLRELDKTRQYLKDILENMSNLMELIKLKKVNKSNLRIVEINNKWRKITNTKLFRYVVQIMMNLQISIYLRYVPVIVQEQDVLIKGELIIKYLGSLVAQILQNYEHLQSYMEMSLSKLETNK